MKLIFTLLLLTNYAVAATIDWDIEFKPSYIISDRELNSHYFNNSTAPTGASRNGSDIDEDLRSSFQMMQSNFGVRVTNNKIKIVSRFDFVDFEKASPTFQLSPRLIELYAEYENLKVGLQYDLFSPLRPKTFNTVGGNFYAGDLGYYRNQVVYSRGRSSYSIGQQKPNIEASEDTDGEVETNFLLQYQYDIDNEGRRYGLSLSYIYFEQYSDADKVSDSKGISVYYKTTSGSNHLLKTELYVGSNLANAGYFALSDPSTNKDLNEIGGFVEYEYIASEKNSFVFGYSKAEVDRRRIQRVHIEVINEVISKGIVSNEKTYISNWHKINKDFLLVSEFTYYNTHINYADFDVDVQPAIVFQIGAIFKIE